MFFFVRVSRKFHSIHCVFPERQQSHCQKLWLQSGALYISIEKEKIKGRPATPVDEFEMYHYDKPEPLPRWGTSFVEVRRETDLSSVLILVTDGIWGMCVLFIKLEASLHGLPIRGG